METKYNNINTNINKAYPNTRPQNPQIVFKPTIYNSFESLLKPTINWNGNISEKTSGTKSNVGDKQNADPRLAIEIDTSNTQKFHWDDNRGIIRSGENMNYRKSSFYGWLSYYSSTRNLNDPIRKFYEDIVKDDTNFPLGDNLTINDYLRYYNNNISNEMLDVLRFAFNLYNKKAMNEWLDAVGDNNILPQNYPANSVVEKNLCLPSTSYHKPVVINLQNNSPDKPRWGTPLGFEQVGPRKMNNMGINTNVKKPFDVTHSGYTITENLPTYSNFKVNKESFRYPDSVRRDNLKKYTNNLSTYNGTCGSKFENRGTILEKNIKNPHQSRFVKHNIIGLNKENKNEPMIFLRNIAKFNNNDLINQDINLNSLKKLSHQNFIHNTNKYRDYVNDNLFEQKTEKLSRNLEYRG